MLNCGQEQAPHILESYLDNDTLRSLEIIDDLVVSNKSVAYDKLIDEGLSNAAAIDVLNVTHCDDLIDQYFIVSDDMISKAPVWSHFGLWNFSRADMYNKGLAPLGVSPDQWISPWLSYEQIDNSLFEQLFFGNSTKCFDLFYETRENPIGLFYRIYTVDLNCH